MAAKHYANAKNGYKSYKHTYRNGRSEYRSSERAGDKYAANAGLVGGSVFVLDYAEDWVKDQAGYCVCNR